MYVAKRRQFITTFTILISQSSVLRFHVFSYPGQVNQFNFRERYILVQITVSLMRTFNFQLFEYGRNVSYFHVMQD